MTAAPPAGHLLERDSALEAGARVLESAANGHGGIVLVEGPAGIGKSSVLRALRDTAPGLAQVRSATGSDVARNFSFGVVIELLEPSVRERGVRGDSLFDGAARMARPLFDDEDGAAPGDEFAFLHGLYWLVARLAEQRPLALVVDDAHWADRSSLRFLAYLSERVADLPVALALAVRTGEPGAPEDLLRPIAARPETVRHRLKALSAGAVSELVRAHVPGASETWCAACHRLTDGNPFLVRELLSAAAAAGIEPTEEGEARLDGFAPDRLRDAVLMRLDRLSEDAGRVARAVAILGPAASGAAVARLAGLSSEAAAEAVDELAAADVLRPGQPVGYRHPLLRSTVYASIAPARRALLHRRAAEILGDAHAPAAAIGDQLLLASAEADVWTVEQVCTAAAEAMERGAPDPAAAFLRRALEEPPPPERRGAILVDLARAEAAAGREEAPARIEEAIGLTADAGEAATLLGELGWMLHKAGRIAEAAATFERALELVDDEEGDLRDQLVMGFVGAAWQETTYAERVADEATRLFERVEGSPDPSLDMLAQLATLRLFAGDGATVVTGHARRVLRGDRLVEEQGADSLTLWHAVACLAWSDELDDAEAAIEVAIAAAERRGLTLTLAQCYYARSWPRYWRGRVDEAVSDAAVATEAWKGGWGYYLPAAVHWLVMAQIERGDLEAAAAALELPGGPDRWRTTTMYALWRHAEASLTMARGDTERALDQFVAAGRSVVEDFMVVNPAVMPWRSEAARAAAELGRTDQAIDLAREELDIARRFGARRPLGAALRAAATIERGQTGLALAREAVAVLEESPSRLELLRALTDEGALLRALGLRREARDPLRRALDLGRDCPGAVATVRRAREELLAVGGRPRRAALAGADALTPTERRIADLAADGLGNRAIAERLFVSARTVEWHLGAVFRKLGIASRDQLAAALAEPGDR